MTHIAVVKDLGIDTDNAQFTVANTKGLCIAYRLRADAITDDADLGRIPVMAILVMIIITPEMFVAKKKSFNVFIVKYLFATRTNSLQILLMDDLVALDIETPVSAACIKGDICLLAVNSTAKRFHIVPHCVNDTYFGIADGFDDSSGGVVGVAVSHGNNKFVAYG